MVNEVKSDISDLQVKVGSSRKMPEFSTWNSELDDHSKRYFLVGAHSFFLQLSFLKCTEVGSQRFPSCFERGVRGSAVPKLTNVRKQCNYALDDILSKGE